MGLYFYLYSTAFSNQEAFTTSSCPNLLIQKGSKIYLHNTKVAKVPGINPLVFNNLEEYVEFLNWQHNRGIYCPVLFLQHSYDAQSNPVYKIRPDIQNPQAGLSSFPSIPMQSNESSIQNQLEMQKMEMKKNESDDSQNKSNTDVHGISADPMDANWGGADYTQNLVDQGVYKGNEVSIYVP